MSGVLDNQVIWIFESKGTYNTFSVCYEWHQVEENLAFLAKSYERNQSWNDLPSVIAIQSIELPFFDQVSARWEDTLPDGNVISIDVEPYSPHSAWWNRDLKMFIYGQPEFPSSRIERF